MRTPGHAGTAALLRSSSTARVTAALVVTLVGGVASGCSAPATRAPAVDGSAPVEPSGPASSGPTGSAGASPSPAPEASPSAPPDDASTEAGAPDDGDLPPFGTGGEPASSDMSADAALHGVGVRFAVHDGFDRVVVDLAGTGAPGWRVMPVDEPQYQAVGGPVPLDGEAALLVQITGIAWTEPGPPFEGETSRSLHGGVVRDLVYGSAFEGEQEVFLGLDAEAPFRVFRLEDPARVVIDVQHP